jgi:hypothetical protein
METKVGKGYILPGETRKRDAREIVWTTVWIILLISWSTFMIVVSINTGFWSMPLKDMVALFLLSNIPTLIFLIGFLFMIKSQEHVRTLEFLIHKYDRWSLNDNAYKTYYSVLMSAWTVIISTVFGVLFNGFTGEWYQYLNLIWILLMSFGMSKLTLLIMFNDSDMKLYKRTSDEVWNTRYTRRR